MKTLHIFDAKDYSPKWQKTLRKAARAVIIEKGKIALVKSKNFGFFKFPGGGIEQGEKRFDALLRETREETGLKIITQSVAPLGIVKEKRKDIYDNGIFIQTSYYYLASVEGGIANQELDGYESEYGFELAWVDLNTAYNTNIGLQRNSEMGFLAREAFVLKYLLDNYDA